MCVDLRTDLARLRRADGEAMRAAFVDWLGGLNRAKASLSWWAHTSTAKNLLSSPLGNECLGVLALQRFVSETPATRVLVIGATPAQIAVLRGESRLTASLEPLLRTFWQFTRIAGLRLMRTLRPAAGDAPQAVIFTYVDQSFRGGADAFFGELAARLPVRSRPVAFVHCAYRSAVAKMDAAGYHALFGELRFADMAWALKMTLQAWWRADRVTAPPLAGIRAEPLLRSALRWDIGQGGYLYNLLVYPAARRLFARWQPRWLLYPYENKALEKMLLAAAREAAPKCRLVGYQHTSITPRHATLLFAEGEAAATPLPDRIVTVGEVTRRFLEQHGRYREGIFATGCALRQSIGPMLERRPRDGKVRLLLALSSSRRELAESVELCRAALTSDASLELAIRTHPEFPVSVLGAGARAWLDKHAHDFTGTTLAANLEWCDAVAYASSTVALEALGRGRPVVNLALSDPLDPDPVLDPVDFHWVAETPQGLAEAARQIAALDSARFERSRAQALDYIARYLGPPTPQALEAFLPG